MNKLDTKGWTDKDSHKPEYRELYEKHGFIEAYGKHTDLRIEKDGPELAIGAKKDGAQDWDIHGNMQLAFLKSRGLKPTHTFLDLGCGTGRLACKMIPYLNQHRYTGIDISLKAIINCIDLVEKEGLESKKPLFINGDGTFSPVGTSRFNLIWAHSVLTHLPPDIIENIFTDLSKMAFGEFVFTYKHHVEPRRSGLKQFQYNPGFFKDLAASVNLTADSIPFEWPAGQKTMKVTWK